MSYKELTKRIIDLYNDLHYDEVIIKHLNKKNILVNDENILKQRVYDVQSTLKHINKLNKVIKKYMNTDLELIYDAIYNATKMHLTHSHRATGTPYITHPLYVSYIVATMNLDSDTIIAALYHDIIEDEDYDEQDILNISNREVMNLVVGLTKLDTNNNVDNIDKREMNKVERDTIYLQQMLSFMQEDIRVIFVKLADRLHNMETLNAKKVDSQKRIARQTMYVFAPVAKKLGMYKIANRLEDLSFKYLYPTDYKKFRRFRNLIATDSYLIDVKKIIDDLLKDKFKYEIRTRIKHVYGIFKHSLEEEYLDSISDLRAIKIILDDSDNEYKDIVNCNEVLQLLKDKFAGSNRVINYLTESKLNGYKGIILEIDNIEIQIYSRSMYNISRYGIAGHYLNMNNSVDANKMIIGFIKNNREISKMYADISNENFILRQLIIGKGNIFIVNEEGNEVPIKERTKIITYLNSKNIDFDKSNVYVNDKLVKSKKYILKMNDNLKVDIK